MPAIILLFIFLAIPVIIAVAILSAYLKRKRQEALVALAGRLGLRFSKDDLPGVGSRYGYFSPLQQGDNRYAFNVLDGEYRGRPLCCFEFHYETHSTDSKGHRTTTDHYLSCAVVPLGAGFPRLVIRPESILDKLAGAIGFDDIDFESAEFSRRFFVKSENKKFAYDILHARAMEYLMNDVERGFAFELAGSAILLYNGNTWDIEQIPRALDALIGFVALIPEYVWQDAKA